VTVFPVVARRPQLLAAAYDPETNYVFNAAAETRGVLIQKKLTPTQKKREVPARRRLPRARERQTSARRSQSWHDHGSISAIDVSTGRRVWKFRRPSRSAAACRSPRAASASPAAATGLRAFDLTERQGPLDVQHGRPIASGPTIFSAGGKEYVAVTVGGTPTSSNGGVASLLQVFLARRGPAARAPLRAREPLRTR
jgi:hypothetical protein